MNNISKKEEFIFRNSSAPLMVALDVTSACNFRCLHCFNDSGCKSSDELTDTEIYQVAQQVAKLNPLVVCLCGGETMLRKNLVDIIRCISKTAGVVNMVSNGSLINEENIYELKNAGIDTIQISLDGLNAIQHDTFRGYVGSFEKAVNAIKLIKKAGINVVVSCTPNKLNHRTIEEYLDFTLGLGVSQVRFMPLIPIGWGSKIESLLLSPEEYVRLQLILETRKEKLKYTTQSIEWGDPLDHFQRMPFNASFGYKAYSMEVKSNGDLAVSTYIPLVVGNVREKSLKEYWDSGYNDIWKNKEVLDYTSKIETVYDINELGSIPYLNEKNFIDLTK